MLRPIAPRNLLRFAGLAAALAVASYGVAALTRPLMARTRVLRTNSV